MKVDGLYWNSHQDGMEYGIKNNVRGPGPNPDGDLIRDVALNTLVESEFLNPDFSWDFGFKIGLGYHTDSDGWDVGAQWIWYRGKANSRDQAETDSSVLLPIWSAFAPKQGLTLYATAIQSSWTLECNVIDMDLGREFWASQYLTVRPFVGIRIAYLDQTFEVDHRGGSWETNAILQSSQATTNNQVLVHNDYRGVGVRGGLDTVWKIGCGWGLYGKMAYAVLYGRFELDYQEVNREVASPHSKIKIANVKDRFRASRSVADFGLGIHYSTMFCDCAYGFSAMLGWEHHLFFDQNQMWRVVRIGDEFNGVPTGSSYNNTGGNIYHQRRGDLDTQGWTLALQFEF